MARAWSPAPSPLARALSSVRPVMTFRCSTCGCRAASVLGSSPVSLPTVAGVQSGTWTPFGTYMNANRFGAPVAARAEPALVWATGGAAAARDSSHGSATSVPRPRRA